MEIFSEKTTRQKKAYLPEKIGREQMTSYMIKHSKLMPKSQKNQNFPDRVSRYGYFGKWHPLKQTKTKI